MQQHSLTIEQRESLQAALEARAETLRPEGLQSLPNHSEETDDDAIVDLENALDVATMERDAAELRSIEGALSRLHTPDYGLCADCEIDIPFTRLQANPLATRCTACQTVFERTHASGAHSTL